MNVTVYAILVHSALVHNAQYTVHVQGRIASFAFWKWVIAPFLDREFNHSRKCLEVPILENLDSRYIWRIQYCKIGNIRGTLIFVNFAQNSASANSKTRENICDSLYAHIWHVGVVYWPCVLMQMGNILKNVWGLLCFCAVQLLVNVSLYDVKYLCNTKISSEYLLSANLTTRECFCAAKREKLIPQN